MKTASKNHFRTLMFPHVFKHVGFAIAIAGALLLILGVCEIIPKQIVKLYFWTVVNAGLFIAVMSKDRHEDEMLRAIRLGAIFGAFAFGILFTIIRSFNDREPMLAEQMVLMMLLYYHVMFWYMKRRARNEKHD